MTSNDFFTPEEQARVSEIHQELTTIARDVLQPDDMEKVRKYQDIMMELGQLQRDPFGLNPFLSDLETALIVTKEIGMTRGSILGVILNAIVLGGALTAEMVEKEFGTDVARVLNGLLRIRELYTKSAAVESENFRSLLVTFAEDMRVILIMIANRVYIMRMIKGTPNVEAQRQVSTEAAYIYAPLAH